MNKLIGTRQLTFVAISEYVLAMFGLNRLYWTYSSYSLISFADIKVYPISFDDVSGLHQPVTLNFSVNSTVLLSRMVLHCV
jgi:hypothetical protein